ncbi:MAG TPA: DUF6152 family protein [Vicinamibacterales bacterium]|jgi:hypothetical protein|nr:DUF6152 family protein [Vicinamibacterales bacterium]
MTRTLAVVAFTVIAVTGAQAHHSSAMYNQEKTLTLRGVVTQVRWTSPHVNVSVLADPGRGQAGVAWVLEATSPGNLMRAGWTRTSIKVGDRVSVVVAPLRDGTHGGWCRGVTLVDSGKKLEC